MIVNACIQWNGEGANKDERFKATQYIQDLKSERGKATVEVLGESPSLVS